MPVILDPADFDLWLDSATPPDAAQALLRPYEGGLEFAARPISTRVNKVANDDPEVLEPLAESPETPADAGPAPRLL